MNHCRWFRSGTGKIRFMLPFSFLSFWQSIRPYNTLKSQVCMPNHKTQLTDSHIDFFFFIIDCHIDLVQNYIAIFIKKKKMVLYCKHYFSNFTCHFCPFLIIQVVTTYKALHTSHQSREEYSATYSGTILDRSKSNPINALTTLPLLPLASPPLLLFFI